MKTFPNFKKFPFTFSIQFQFFGKLRYYFEQHSSPKFYKNRFLTTLKDVLAEFN